MVALGGVHPAEGRGEDGGEGSASEGFSGFGDHDVGAGALVRQGEGEPGRRRPDDGGRGGVGWMVGEDCGDARLGRLFGGSGSDPDDDRETVDVFGPFDPVAPGGRGGGPEEGDAADAGFGGEGLSSPHLGLSRDVDDDVDAGGHHRQCTAVRELRRRGGPGRRRRGGSR